MPIRGPERKLATASSSVFIDLEFTAKVTGERVSAEDENHVWRFGPDGKVVRFRHGVDPHAHPVAIGK